MGEMKLVVGWNLAVVSQFVIRQKSTIAAVATAAGNRHISLSRLVHVELL